MAAIENQIDKRPRMSYGGSVAVTSGQAFTPMCMYFIINLTTSTSVTFTMADGSSAALGTLPIGVYEFELQATEVTLGTANDGTVVGFYNP